jgi:hypothetical protein
MGFGILTGTMTGTMLASTAIVPTPASAHPVTQSGPFGQIALDEGHTRVFIQDYVCHDGVGITAQLKYPSGELADLRYLDCQTVVDDFPRLFPGFYAIRKCVNPDDLTSPLVCSDSDWIVA